MIIIVRFQALKIMITRIVAKYWLVVKKELLLASLHLADCRQKRNLQATQIFNFAV